MPTTGERLSAIETMVGEIHTAVIGNGSAGSSLRERTAALEEWRRNQDGLKHRGVRAASQAILTAAVAIIVHTLGLPYGAHS